MEIDAKCSAQRRTDVSPRLLDVKQSSIYLSVSTSRIRQYIRFRKLHPVTLPHPWKTTKDSRKVLLDIRELDHLIEECSEWRETKE